MYARVPTARKHIAAYESVIGAEAVDDLRRLASPLSGARVLHLTATAFGAGPPEELSTLVPLMDDLGIDCDWQVVRGTREFARANKAIAEALGGMKVHHPEHLIETWARYNAMNAALFEGKYDFVVVHDPQAAGLRAFLSDDQRGESSAAKWVWHCHVDLSAANSIVWHTLRSYLDCCYDAAIFAAKQYVRSDLDVPVVAIVPPVIDSLNTANMEVDQATLRHIVHRFGIDPTRALVCQVARYVKWNDPEGVIDAYRAAKRSLPDLQLVLVWSMPGPTAENWRRFQRVAAHVGNDPDIHLLSNLNEVGNFEQNVFQRAAGVVVHRSLRRGFASTVAEASWKARPVVVDRVGIMPGQVLDGQTGFLVDNIAHMAERVVELLRDPARAQAMGRAGHEHVRHNFLVTRAMHDYLVLFNDLTSGRAIAAGA